MWSNCSWVTCQQKSPEKLWLKKRNQLRRLPEIIFFLLMQSWILKKVSKSYGLKHLLNTNQVPNCHLPWILKKKRKKDMENFINFFFSPKNDSGISLLNARHLNVYTSPLPTSSLHPIPVGTTSEVGLDFLWMSEPCSSSKGSLYYYYI